MIEKMVNINEDRIAEEEKLAIAEKRGNYQDLPFIVNNACLNCRGKNFYIKRQGYNSYNLFLILEGSIIFRQDNVEHIVTEGEILIFKNFECLEIKAYNCEKVKYYNIGFAGICANSYYNLCFSDGFNIIKVSNVDFYVGKILQMYNNIKNSVSNCELKNANMLMDMYTNLVEKNLNSKQQDYPNWYNECLKYIEDNLSNKLTTIELIEKTNFSKAYLIRKFKEFSGYTPYEYITKQKITKSRQMLIATDLPLRYISKKLQFSSTSQFIKKFKIEYGATPSVYKKNALNDVL